MDVNAWCVVRTDDNGFRHVVAHNLTHDEAVLLEQKMIQRGHKQFYQILQQTNLHTWLDQDRAHGSSSIL